MLQIKNNKLAQRIFMLTVLVIGLFLAGGDASHGMTRAASIDGEWDAAMNTPGGVRNFKIIFKVDGEKVTGTVKRATGDAPLTGTLKGNDLEFAYTINYNGNDLTISMTGKVDGDTVKGKVSFNGQAEEEWSAKRAAAAKP